MDNENKRIQRASNGAMFQWQYLNDEELQTFIANGTNQTGRLILQEGSRGTAKHKLSSVLGLTSDNIAKYFRRTNGQFRDAFFSLAERHRLGLHANMVSIQQVALNDSLDAYSTIYDISQSNSMDIPHHLRMSASKEILQLSGSYKGTTEPEGVNIQALLVQLTQTSNTYLPAGIEPVENRSRVVDT